MTAPAAATIGAAITMVVERVAPTMDKHGRQVDGYYQTYTWSEAMRPEDEITRDFGAGLYDYQFFQGSNALGEKKRLRVPYSTTCIPLDRERKPIEVASPQEVLKTQAPIDPLYAMMGLPQPGTVPAQGYGFPMPRMFPGGGMSMGMPSDPTLILTQQLSEQAKRIQELERRLEEQRADHDRRVEGLRQDLATAKEGLANERAEKMRAEDRFRAEQRASEQAAMLGKMEAKLEGGGGKQDALTMLMIESWRAQQAQAAQAAKPTIAQQAMENAMARMIERQLDPDDGDDGPPESGLAGQLAPLVPLVLDAMNKHNAPAPAPAGAVPVAPQIEQQPAQAPTVTIQRPAAPQPYASGQLAKALIRELDKIVGGADPDRPEDFVREASAWLTQPGRTALIEACKKGTVPAFLAWFTSVPGINLGAVTAAFQQDPKIAAWLSGLRDAFTQLYGGR